MLHLIFLLNCCIPAAICYGFNSNLCKTYEGLAGECRRLDFCQTARQHISRGRQVATCQYAGQIPVVCCELQQRLRQPNVRQGPRWGQPQQQNRNPGHYFRNTFQSTSRPWAYQTPRDPDSVLFPYTQDRRPSQALTAVDETATVKPGDISGLRIAGVDPNDKKCPPLPEEAINEKGVKSGRKALDKCIEYVGYVYPCQKDSETQAYTRVDICIPRFRIAIVGGNYTRPNEYPHMVVLGFGQEMSEAQWLCGATLISDYFVLTAGHCVYSPEYGPVTYARAGVDHLSAEVDPKSTYRVAQIIKHPRYKAPVKYYDIALLRMDRRVEFNRIVRPACLYTETEMPSTVTALGWGVTENAGNISDALMSVDLHTFSPEDCRKTNEPARNIRSGIITDLQFCAGDSLVRKDTCQGDSGGPLQVFNPFIHCSYNIVGITSFGKSCGTPGIPAVYTRISTFVPWIESVVWP